MKYQSEISKIIEGGIYTDKIKVKNYAALLIDKLEKDGENKTANSLRKVLNSSFNSLEAMDSVFKKLDNTPVDADSRYSMVDIVYPDAFKKELVLNENIEVKINYFIQNYRKSDELSKAGLDMANKLLLYGPPGNGKTQTAHYIANKLNLPLLITRLDSVISSYLGTTSKNIRALFEYADQIPCVLLLDEFDAIAKNRDDNNELGELKRVVNSLLQNIDKLNNNSLLIAATNHENLLDSAVWRRFDYKIRIGLPEIPEITRIVILLAPELITFSTKLEVLSYLLYGKSGAEIEMFIKQERRESIINEHKFTIDGLMGKCMDELFSENYMKSNIETNEKIKLLRNMSSKIFTYEIISDLVGVSKSTISNVLKGE